MFIYLNINNINFLFEGDLEWQLTTILFLVNESNDNGSKTNDTRRMWVVENISSIRSTKWKGLYLNITNTWEEKSISIGYGKYVLREDKSTNWEEQNMKKKK